LTASLLKSNLPSFLSNVVVNTFITLIVIG
jgi:hypothetical protein